MKLKQPKIARTQYVREEDWQRRAWGFFDDIPEVSEGVSYCGNQLGKIRFYMAVDNPEPDGVPLPVSDEKSGIDPAMATLLEATFARFRSQSGGQTENIRTLNQNLEVAGAAWVVFLAPRKAGDRGDGPLAEPLVHDEPEDCIVVSLAEIREDGGVFTLLNGPGAGVGRDRMIRPDLGDFLSLVFLRHPHHRYRPHSSMRALLTDCQALLALAHQEIAEAYSRRSAGLLLISNEITFGHQQPADTDPDHPINTQDQLDEFERELGEVLAGPIEDPTHPGSVQPTIVRGPKEALHPDAFRHLTFDRSTDETLTQRIEAKVLRIARGLPMPVEKLLGSMNTTFANGQQIDQDEWQDYHQPRAVVIADALTSGFMTQICSGQASDVDDSRVPEAPAIPPDVLARVYVWFDPTDLVGTPDVVDSADQGVEMGAIGMEAWRRAKGWSEDDAPTDMEVLIHIVTSKRGAVDPVTAGEILRPLAKAAGIELPPPPKVGEPAPGEPPAPKALPSGPPPKALPPGRAPDAKAQAAMAVLAEYLEANGVDLASLMVDESGRITNRPKVLHQLAARSGSSAPGHQLMALDRDLRTRLLQAADDAMNRALERAGNRVRNSLALAAKNHVKHVGPLELAATLGETAVTALLAGADPFAGAWDHLEQQFKGWASGASDEALDVAYRVTSGFSTEERQALKMRMVASTDEAWLWMRDSLATVGHERIFNPHPQAPEFGELSNTTVPPGLVRQAMARAGGATSIRSDDEGTGAWIAVSADGGPLGGIGTGRIVGDVIRDGGGAVEGYRWVYGPGLRHRPFEPHRQLDGQEFGNFDDESLATSGAASWLPFSQYMPGDHAGCQCDFEPILLSAAAGPSSAPITDEELGLARSYLPDLRRLIAQDAARTQAEAFSALDAADALRIQKPPRGPKMGEWDWLNQITPEERNRIVSEKWSTASHTASIDNIADRLRAALPGLEDYSDDQIITEVWLPRTRQIDAAGALRSGRMPSARVYSAGVDVNDLAPRVAHDGYDIARVMRGGDDAANHIAEVWREQGQREAERVLGRSLHATAGPAPWNMTVDSWVNEVLDLDYQLANYPRDTTRAAAARLDELLPEDLDRPGMTLEEIHALIRNTARLAGEWVP